MINKLKVITTALAVAATSALSTLSAAEPQSHNFANYNIRYVNPNNGDTGEKHWSQRGTYVTKLIKDYAFDIVGMQEVTGRNGGSCVNSSTGRSQLEDLKAWLPDYTFLEWERSGNNNAKDYSYNVIAYKKDRYECLQSGCFWLSPSPDTPGPGWDPNPDYSGIWRTCGWAKMKVKATGEIFYFAVTHCNYGPSLDGQNSGPLISKRLDAISGNYPVVLVGDFNMRRADHAVAYRGYASNFYDAALTAKENSCLPTSNPSTTVTGQNWYPVSSSLMSGSEFDFCFYRNMDVLSRHIITENYGRSVNPSDHFPILMRCVLLGEQAPATVHVDGEAAAGGDGSASHPFAKLADGIAATGIRGTVKVAAGTYAERLDIPASMTVIGGYDSSFSEIEGRSAIDASAMDDSPVCVANYHSFSLVNFEINNYSSSKMSTDGALRFNGQHLSLDNVHFANNSSFNTGGALNVISGGDLTLENCRFCANKAGENGGAVAAKLTGALTAANCTFENNSAKSGAALTLTDADEMLLRNSAFIGNTAKNSGAVYLRGCPSASKYTIVNSTFASNTLDAPSGLPVVTRKFGGAAICTDFESDVRLNMAHLTVTGNTATFAGSNKSNFNGAAINFFGLGRLNLVNSIVAANSSDIAHSDIWLGEEALAEKSRFNIYSCPASVSFACDATDFTANDASTAVTEIAALLDGKIGQNGLFEPNAAIHDENITPIVAPIGTVFAGQAVNVLTNYQRMLENQFGHDIDGNGTIGGVLAIDQCGNKRLDSSMPGAAEYIEYSGVEDIAIDSDASISIRPLSTYVYAVNGLSEPAILSNTSGIAIEILSPDAEGSATIDLSSRASGVYILATDDKSFKILKK